MKQTKTTSRALKLLDRIGFGGAIPPDDVRHLQFPGIYVLGFSDQTFYVGQSISLERRLSDHRRNLGPAWIRVKRVSRGKLDEAEFDTLYSLEGIQAKLLNIDGAATTVLELPFDSALAPALQSNWITEPSAVPDCPRQQLPSQRLKYEKRFQDWKRGGWAGATLDFLSRYVPTAIPMPCAIEGNNYSVSCLNPDRQIVATRINIYRQEVVAVDPDRKRGWFAYFLAPIYSLEADIQRLTRRHSSIGTDDGSYFAGGWDQGVITAATRGAADAILSDSAISQGLRRFNLGLARKGGSLWRRSHCPQMLDGVL